MDLKATFSWASHCGTGGRGGGAPEAVPSRHGARQGGGGAARPPHPPASWGAAPPQTACISKGLRTPDPPEKALRALGCSGWSLSLDRASCLGQLRCQGQNLFQKINFFLKKQRVRGSFAAWGRVLFFKKIVLF